jgi:uncharacterized protein (DUF1697 family)
MPDNPNSDKMQIYISLLRGINMTGHNSLRMNDLSDMYKDMGFTDAETYIQSGNVIFSTGSEVPATVISLRIETAILDRFNYKVPVMIRTITEMKSLVSANPFLQEENFDPAKMAVIFLHEECKISQIREVADINYPPDKFKISGREIFLLCPNGFGRTKLYTNFFEKKMGVTGTARNWKTINTIIDMAERKINNGTTDAETD